MKKILILLVLVFYSYWCWKVDDASLWVQDTWDFVSADKEIIIPELDNQPNY